jgi:hypothetical protein
MRDMPRTHQLLREKRSRRMPQERFARGGWLLWYAPVQAGVRATDVSAVAPHRSSRRFVKREEPASPVLIRSTVSFACTRDRQDRGALPLSRCGAEAASCLRALLKYTKKHRIARWSRCSHDWINHGNQHQGCTVPIRLSQQKGSPQQSVPRSVPKRGPRTIIPQPTPTKVSIKNGPEIMDFRPAL